MGLRFKHLNEFVGQIMFRLVQLRNINQLLSSMSSYCLEIRNPSKGRKHNLSALLGKYEVEQPLWKTALQLLKLLELPFDL